MKKYILFDHDGVLVDTEHWYYKAGERALAEIGLLLDPDQGAGTWAQAKAAGVDDHTIDRLREVRNAYYQEYLLKTSSSAQSDAHPVSVERICARIGRC